MLYLGLPPDELCAKVADILGDPSGAEGLFVFNGDLVTVEPRTGVVTPMKSATFRTWLPGARNVMPVVKWEKETGLPIKGGLRKDDADVILNSEILRSRLPVLTGVHKVRMPVQDGQVDERGLRPWRLLRRGYDESTGIFTAASLDYDEDMPFDDAVNYFYRLFHTFSWRNENRDFAIHLATLVTMFCPGLYAGRPPATIYNANIQSSGKTNLAWYVTWLVHGSRETKPLPEEQEARLIETLNSVALMGDPYVLFDNVDWGSKPVRSQFLDQWISGEEWSFRKLNTNTTVAPQLRAVTLMTGNTMRVSPDIQRRALMVDLWNPQSATERVLPPDAVLFDGDFFRSEQRRKEGLAALWSIVKAWDQAGRPMKDGKQLATFESWSRVVPQIVWHAGQAAGGRAWDCLAPSSNEEIGDKDTREYKLLAEMAIAEFGRDGNGDMQEAFEVTVQQFAGVARRNAVAVGALWPEQDVAAVMTTEGKKDGWKFEPPATDDFPPQEGGDEVARMRSASEWMTPKTRSSFGKALDGRMNDRYFSGPDGQLYHLRKLPRVSPARYAVARVKTKA